MESVKAFDMNGKFTRENYRIVWRLEAFNLMPFIREHPLFGPSIRLGKDTDSTWQLLMAKQRNEEDKLPSIGFKLVKTEDNTIWDVCRFDVAIRSEDKKLFLQVFKNALAGGEDDMPYKCVKGALEDSYVNEDDVIQIDDDSPLKNGSKKSPKPESEESKILASLFKENVVLVECDIRYTYLMCDPDEDGAEVEERLVVQDLKHLYRSQKFSDFILRVGKKEFPVHKSILCTRAYGFDFILQEQEERPSAKGTMDVNFPESVVDVMLLFIYTGEFPAKMNASDCFDLYKASCKYGIHRLKDICYKMLKDMANEHPSCGNCDTEEEKFLKLIQGEKVEMSDLAELVIPAKAKKVALAGLEENGLDRATSETTVAQS